MYTHCPACFYYTHESTVQPSDFTDIFLYIYEHLEAAKRLKV